MYYSSDLLCLQQLHCIVLLTGVETTVTGQCRLQNVAIQTKMCQFRQNVSIQTKCVNSDENVSKNTKSF